MSSIIGAAPAPAWSPRCNTCGAGSLIRKKKYRMSGPVVVIGYILILPSILGILISVFIFLAALAAGGSTAANAAASANASSAAGVAVGTAIGGGIALFLGLASLVGGLLGWLLIMKKRVLECNVCSATVSAS